MSGHFLHAASDYMYMWETVTEKCTVNLKNQLKLFHIVEKYLRNVSS